VPVSGFQTITLKQEIVAKLNEYSKIVGVKPPSLIAAIVEKLDSTRDLNALLRSLELSKKIDGALLLSSFEEVLHACVWGGYWIDLIKREASRKSSGIRKLYEITEKYDVTFERAEETIVAAFKSVYPAEYLEFIAEERDTAWRVNREYSDAIVGHLRDEIKRFIHTTEYLEQVFGESVGNLPKALNVYVDPLLELLNELEALLHRNFPTQRIEKAQKHEKRTKAHDKARELPPDPVLDKVRQSALKGME
jgi:hypothetical protein